MAMTGAPQSRRLRAHGRAARIKAGAGFRALPAQVCSVSSESGGSWSEPGVGVHRGSRALARTFARYTVERRAPSETTQYNLVSSHEE